MPIEPVRPRTNISVVRDVAATRARSSGVTSGRTPNQRQSPAPPDAATCRGRRTCAGPARRLAQQRGFERRIDDIGDDGGARQRREIDFERRLADHAERGGVDEKIGALELRGGARHNRRSSIAASGLPRRASPRARVRLTMMISGDARGASAQRRCRARRRRRRARRTYARPYPSRGAWRREAQESPRHRCCRQRVFPLPSTGYSQRRCAARDRRAPAQAAKAASLCGRVTLAADGAAIRENRRETARSSGAHRYALIAARKAKLRAASRCGSAASANGQSASR